MDKPSYFCYNEVGDCMAQKWFQELWTEETQFLLVEIAKKYQLSKEEYVNLIDILFYSFVVNSDLHILENVTFVVDKILENREFIQKNQNYRCFSSCLQHFLEEEYRRDSNFTRLEEFLRSGFVFHSFNRTFYPQIQDRGLVVKEKPWDLEEIEQVRRIFQKYGKQNIFGYYNGREATPIFFANNLETSPYYGLSSPTFFRKFIENKKEYFNVFLNRDYPSACASMEELTKPLTPEEKAVVFHFFEKYWREFATDTLPCVAISTKEKLGIEEETVSIAEGESITEYYLKRILDARNHMIKRDIPRDSLEIFDYETLSFSIPPKEKNI